MGGDNEAFMTIEIRRGFYNDCRIYGSIRKWYHGALSENDLRWEEFIEAIENLERILELPENHCINGISAGLKWVWVLKPLMIALM